MYYVRKIDSFALTAKHLKGLLDIVLSDPSVWLNYGDLVMSVDLDANTVFWLEPHVLCP